MIVVQLSTVVVAYGAIRWGVCCMVSSSSRYRQAMVALGRKLAIHVASDSPTPSVITGIVRGQHRPYFVRLEHKLWHWNPRRFDFTIQWEGGPPKNEKPGPFETGDGNFDAVVDVRLDEVADAASLPHAARTRLYEIGATGSVHVRPREIGCIYVGGGRLLLPRGETGWVDVSRRRYRIFGSYADAWDPPYYIDDQPALEKTFQQAILAADAMAHRPAESRQRLENMMQNDPVRGARRKAEQRLQRFDI